MNRRTIRELKRKVRQALGLRNTFGDRIAITDEVLVYEGDKLLFKSKGHIVNQGLIGIINLMGSIDSAAYKLPSSGSAVNRAWTVITYQYMRVGTGTGVTTSAMTALVIPDATAPNSQSGAIASPELGTYRVSWIATWNAGSLAAIDVSELGIFLSLDTVLNAFEAIIATVDSQLFSRLSDSDGDFTTFTVNVAVPLTIEWRLTLTFA